LRNGVRVAKDRFLIAIVPLDRELDADRLSLAGKIDHRWMDGFLILIQVFHEGANTALILENIPAIAFLVLQRNPNA